jgi:hypothetical protein
MDDLTRDLLRIKEEDEYLYKRLCRYRPLISEVDSNPLNNPEYKESTLEALAEEELSGDSPDAEELVDTLEDAGWATKFFPSDKTVYFNLPDSEYNSEVAFKRAEAISQRQSQTEQKQLEHYR